MLRIWRFITIVLSSLALTMTSAHVLELPQKMQYGPQLYTSVNTTMYRYFAIVGGVYSMSSIVAAVVLAILVRNNRPVFWWTLAGVVLFVLWFFSWRALVAPVNNQVAAALQSAPESVPELWMRLRVRWEFGHATGFVIQLLGFSALVISIIIETPRRIVIKALADESPEAQS
jgi:hypothetical protein